MKKCLKMCADMNETEDKARLQAQIDENLKRVYQEALEQDVPDRFKDLIEQLRQKDAKK